MKHYFTKILMLMTLLVSVNTIKAELVIKNIGSNITDVNQLTDGCYVAFFNKGRNAYVYYKEGDKYEMSAKPTGISCAWQVIVSGDKYKFKDYTGKFLPKLGSGQTIASGVDETQSDVFSITKSGDSWLIQGTDNNYFNGNAPGQGFVGYNQSGGNSNYEIRLLTVEEGQEITSTYNFQYEDGSTMKTEQVNLVVGTETTIPAVEFMTLKEIKDANNNVITVTDGKFTVTETMSNITLVYQDNLPFKTTTITEGQFAAETEWYQLSIHNTGNRAYLKYDETTKTVIPVKAGMESVYDEAQQWCITGSVAKGVKVYNKAAGASLCMTFNTSNVSMTETGSSWTLRKTRSTTAGFENAFCLRNSDKYINYNATDNALGYWTDNDDGSAIIAWSFDDYVTRKEASMRASTAAPTGAVGTPKAGFDAANTAIDNFVANPTKENEEAVYAALNADPVTFSADNYYRVMTTGRGGQHYLTAGITLSGTDLNKNSASQIWKFKAKDDNYQFTSQNVYTTTPKQSQTVSTTEDDNAAQIFTLNKREDGYALYAIAPVVTTGSAFELHLGGALDIVGWNGGGASSWYLIPETDIDVTITDAGYATINYPFAVQLPEGLTAYTGTVTGNKLVLDEVEGDIIPANSPVVLAGNAKTYTLTILTNNADPKLTSDLEGNCLAKAIDEVTNAYVLAKPADEEVGFYRLSDEAAKRTIGANKAYLTVTNPTGIKAFTFDFGGTTGIENMEAVTEAEEYYDLQGRRVQNPTKGIYVTKSGKKVLFTK